ncbi:MAG: bacterial transcriptional activator domain-containing protein [Chloroflexota bacterium]|nr:bacterial transcriptional activator domain-containing protein [Chloroflexota bacterium]
MNFSPIIEQIYAHFCSITDVHAILLHPRSRYRSLLVARLVSDPELRSFYYALSHNDIRLDSFVTGLMNEIAAQFPLFGYHLNQLSGTDWNDFSQLLSAFTADLAELGNEPFLLILDEYDYTDTADAIQTFVEGLIIRIPSHGKIVINSRTLPRLPWLSLMASRHAMILDDDQTVVEHFYNPPKQSTDMLDVRALGPGFVTFNGHTVDIWEGHLPRLLFFFALDRPVITRSEICQAFWATLDAEQAVNVFHVTKRRLHKALNTDVLIHEDGIYRINPNLDLHYDAAEFVTLLLNGRDIANPNRIDAYQRALELYRGAFLLGHSDRWIVERRAHYQIGYLEAINAIAGHWLADQRPEHALSVYQHALVDAEWRETIQCKIMRLYLLMGRRSEAAAQLQRVIEEAHRANRPLETETEQIRIEILAAK